MKSNLFKIDFNEALDIEMNMLEKKYSSNVKKALKDLADPNKVVRINDPSQRLQDVLASDEQIIADIIHHLDLVDKWSCN